MLEDDPHKAYRELLSKVAADVVPDVIDQDAAIAERIDRIRGYLNSGTSYPKLAQDLQFARNPTLVSTHPGKSRRRIEKTAELAEKAAAEDVARALAKVAIAKQARLEVELFDHAEPVAPDIPESREKPGAEGYDLRYLGRLIGQFEVHCVARSAVQTAPTFALSSAAELIGWAARDRQFQDPKNPFPHLHKAGLLVAWRDELSDEEALWIERATANDPREVRNEIKRVFGIDLPHDYPLSDALLMGMARLAESAKPLSSIDWEAFRQASAIVESNEVAFVKSTLGLDDKHHAAAEKIVSFLKHRVDDVALRNFEQSVAFDLIRIMIDDLDPSGTEPASWLPEFCEKIQNLARQLAPITRSEEVFYALMHAAFDQSIAKANFAEMDKVRRAKDAHRRNMESLDDALESGLPFKFRDDGKAILEDDPEYHLIAQQPMTRETYMATSTSKAGAALRASIGEPEPTGDRTIAKENGDAQGEQSSIDGNMDEATRSPANEAELGSNSASSDPPLTPAGEDPRDSNCGEIKDSTEAPRGRPDRESGETKRRPNATVPVPSTQMTILPSPSKTERGHERQSSLFDVDDKDVI